MYIIVVNCPSTHPLPRCPQDPALLLPGQVARDLHVMGNLFDLVSGQPCDFLSQDNDLPFPSTCVR